MARASLADQTFDYPPGGYSYPEHTKTWWENDLTQQLADVDDPTNFWRSDLIGLTHPGKPEMAIRMDLILSLSEVGLKNVVLHEMLHSATRGGGVAAGWKQREARNQHIYDMLHEQGMESFRHDEVETLLKVRGEIHENFEEAPTEIFAHYLLRKQMTDAGLPPYVFRQGDHEWPTYDRDVGMMSRVVYGLAKSFDPSTSGEELRANANKILHTMWSSNDPEEVKLMYQHYRTERIKFDQALLRKFDEVYQGPPGEAWLDARDTFFDGYRADPRHIDRLTLTPEQYHNIYSEPQSYENMFGQAIVSIFAVDVSMPFRNLSLVERLNPDIHYGIASPEEIKEAEEAAAAAEPVKETRSQRRLREREEKKRAKRERKRK